MEIPDWIQAKTDKELEDFIELAKLIPAYSTSLALARTERTQRARNNHTTNKRGHHMTYEEAIYAALGYFGEAVVMTSGYDEEIADHINDLEEDDREVYIEYDAPIYIGEHWVTGWRIYWVNADGYIASSEPAASVIPEKDYKTMKEK